VISSRKFYLTAGLSTFIRALVIYVVAIVKDLFAEIVILKAKAAVNPRADGVANEVT
jgi:hypothetical protein